MLNVKTLSECSLVQPKDCNAALVIEDGTVFWGRGAGACNLPYTKTVGEICFNTSLTGYQEIITDPSYAGQIITFTFPHIGNVGTNNEDIESLDPAINGCVDLMCCILWVGTLLGFQQSNMQ